MKYVINSMYFESYDTIDCLLDGIFIINAPDGTDVKKTIKDTIVTLANFQDLTYDELEELSQLPKEELETYEQEVLDFTDTLTKKGFTLEQIDNWRDEHCGSSLESILELVTILYPNWSYQYLVIDEIFNADSDSFME